MSDRRSVLERRLDLLFSLIIRTRDKGGKCITCGMRFRGDMNLITCGHFQKRGHRATRWDLENAYGQCSTCNIADDQDKYTEAMIERFGEYHTESIIKKAHTTVHYSQVDLENIYSHLLTIKEKLLS